MGRELQKKKRRSGRAPVRNHNRSKKVLNPRGNNVIAKNWDKKETLAQNYRRLGLLARLKPATGGTQKSLSAPSTRKDPFAIATTDKAIVSEARVERDDNGRILRVISHHNPLDDLIPDSDDEGEQEDGNAEEWGGIDDGGETEVVKSLREEAGNAAPPRVRHQSGGETEWLTRLVERHGHDYEAMARDGRLNPMQQTARDIARRVARMRR